MGSVLLGSFSKVSLYGYYDGSNLLKITITYSPLTQNVFPYIHTHFRYRCAFCHHIRAATAGSLSSTRMKYWSHKSRVLHAVNLCVEKALWKLRCLFVEPSRMSRCVANYRNERKTGAQSCSFPFKIVFKSFTFVAVFCRQQILA